MSPKAAASTSPAERTSLPSASTILRQDLANGMRLLSYQNPSSPALVIRGYLPGGGIAESPQKKGTASLMARMLMAGTLKQKFRKLNDRLESIGASLGFGAGELNISFGGQCLREDLPKLLQILQDVLDQPSFPPAQFERYKMQTLTMLAIQAEDSYDQADRAFNRLFYGSHPYALPLLGTEESIEALTRDDLVQFHEQYLGPQGMVLSIVGGIDPEQAAKICESTLGGWQRPQQQPLPDLPAFYPPQQTLQEHIPLEEKSQTDLIVGTLSPETMSRAYYAASVGNNILGQFGMMGRLGNSVREKAGLAYGIQSELGGGVGPSPWLISAGVNPSNRDKAVKLILKELERFITSPVSQSELANARTQMVGRLPLSLESNAGIAQALLSMERYSLSLDYFKELPGLLASITAEEILNAAKASWHLDRLVIASAGSPR